MVQGAEHFIKEYHMLEQRDRVVAGISGGADSVALLLLLLHLRSQYELEIIAVHINHGLRGKEADRDEEFVKKLCQQKGVECITYHINVKDYARKNGCSEEEAGRDIRYKAFQEIKQRKKYNKIAVAHNKNDSVETILFNLFRGSGLSGITGIPPINGDIIRPLLDTRREEIEKYLTSQEQSYCIDSTNLKSDYSRNKIRLQIIPYIEKCINPKVIEHIESCGTILSEIESFIRKEAEKAYYSVVKKIEKGYSISVDRFCRLDIVIQKEVICMLLFQLSENQKDITAEHIEMVHHLFRKQVGKYIMLPYRIRGKREYKSVLLFQEENRQTTVQKYQNPYENISISIPGDYILPEQKGILYFSLKNNEKNLIIPNNSYTKWFDYDKIKNTVCVRTRQEGDYLIIDKEGRKKKLKSIFIDNKIPREKREEKLLLADGSHIMWILDGRTSEGYRIDENTRKILVVKLDGGYKNGGENQGIIK